MSVPCRFRAGTGLPRSSGRTSWPEGVEPPSPNDRFGVEGFGLAPPRSRACIEDALAEVEDRQSLTATFADLIDRYYAMVQYDPAMRDIWSGTQADKQLMRDQIFASAMVTPRREGEPAKVRVATDALKSES